MIILVSVKITVRWRIHKAMTSLFNNFDKHDKGDSIGQTWMILYCWSTSCNIVRSACTPVTTISVLVIARNCHDKEWSIYLLSGINDIIITSTPRNVKLASVLISFPRKLMLHFRWVKQTSAGMSHIIRGRPVMGGAYKFCSDRLSIFTISTAGKFIPRYTEDRIFILNSNKFRKREENKKW